MDFMDFKEATDRATRSGITLAEIGKATGVSHQTVRRARLDPNTNSYRPPPEGWEVAIARLAKTRSDELAGLAKKLLVGSSVRGGS